jgi:hypothetical protein
MGRKEGSLLKALSRNMDRRNEGRINVNKCSPVHCFSAVFGPSTLSGTSCRFVYLLGKERAG